MKPIVLSLLAGAAGLVSAASAIGCGGSEESLPEDAVAAVGGTVITKADYERALRFATGSTNDPRDYAACVAAKRKSAGASGSQPGGAQLEARCREEYEQIKTDVMDYLIKAEWTRQEAEARGIALSDAQVEQVVERAQGVGLLQPEALESAGVSENEVFARVRYNQLDARITAEMRAETSEVSAPDVAAYYQRTKADRVVPFRRKARIVIAKTRARAQAARDALVAGRSWDSVAKEYSLHISRSYGGKITAEWEHPDKAGLGAALFRAKAGALTGPVQDHDNWAIFEAAEMERSYRPTLEESRDEIVKQLHARREKQARAAYAAKYRDQTTCAPGFEIPACENGPERAEGA
jgi:parvulin-like peptidyl-prolyl isomerase